MKNVLTQRRRREELDAASRIFKISLLLRRLEGMVVNAIDEDLPFWLALNKVPGIGAKRFALLIECFGSAKAAWEGTRRELEAAGIGSPAAQAILEARKQGDPREELIRAAREGYTIVRRCDPNYPRLLDKIPDPPPVLYLLGELLPEDEASVAVVGTRTATPIGLQTAERLAEGFARQRITVVSGMARGIDTAAHLGALGVGGRTIAVLGSGLDVVYPPENYELYERIANRGAVITEFPLGTGPLPGNFPARNRIISGLSLGVVVVEAARDSGSLITAGHALEQGRDVFAVPGPLDLEGSKGPHRLIKQGAKLIEGVQDVLADLRLPLLEAEETAAAVEPQDLTSDEDAVWRALTHEPRHVDMVVRDTGLASGIVGAALVMLQIKGLVRQWAGSMYSRQR